MFIEEAKVLNRMLRGIPRTGSHRQRLDGFYGPQADYYDTYRERLLHGRADLLAGMEIKAGHNLVELGAGTGRNLEFLGDITQSLHRIDLVDLCAPLLNKARQRYAQENNIHIHETDAAWFRPAEPVDRVFLSYSLTMMPDWKDVIENALAMLKPGGLIGVADFYVSSPDAPAGRVQHRLLTRTFWKRWFAHDGVFLNPEHLDYLESRFSRGYLREGSGSLPRLPVLRVPYYVYIGRKES